MASKKPNFKNMIDHSTDPKEKNPFFSESQEDHEKRIERKKLESLTTSSDSSENEQQPKRRTKENLSKRANFLLKPSVHSRFKNFTKSHDLTMNSVVNELIEQYLREHNA